MERGVEFESRRQELNVVLSFAGLEYGKDGQFREVSATRTLDEAERRAKTIQEGFVPIFKARHVRFYWERWHPCRLSVACATGV